MRYEPHDYQTYASEYIIDHPIAAVLLQMGLGKTVITLTAVNDLLFDFFDIRRCLVIAPIRVCQNTWPQELSLWDHLKGLRYSLAVGTETARRRAMESQADIYITNRESVVWVCEKYPEFFTKDTMVVVDELSSFKNHQSKRFKALMKMRPKVERIVGLTGTPSSNGLMDLFAEFKLLDMGARLGRFIGQYRSWYFRPDRMNGPIVYSYKPLPGAEDYIYEKIADITISMKSTDHLKMPELISTTHEVEMSEKEAEEYKRFKDELVLSLKGGEITAANAASLSGKLLQLSNGAVYDDDGKVLEFHERKLDALEDIIESMNGNPILICYNYHHDRERIKKRFPDAEDIKSEEQIRRWNEKKILIGLMHPMSVGFGVNLQKGGNTMVWFGLQYSLENYQQAVARLWRQGQESDTVVVTHIVTRGTIDERVMKVLSDKDNTQAALMDAVKAELMTKASVESEA